MHPIIQNHEPDYEEILDFIKKELTHIRTGRANPSLVEDVLVEAYGVKTPVKQLGSISIPEARVIVVQPWDKNIIKDLEKGLVAANLGLSVVNEGTLVRLTVPQLTEESRKELVKKVNEKLEQARIRVRRVRDNIKEEIVRAEKNKELTEDDKYKAIEDLDEMTREYNDQIKELGEKKEREIMTV